MALYRILYCVFGNEEVCMRLINLEGAGVQINHIVYACTKNRIFKTLFVKSKQKYNFKISYIC